MNPLKQVLSVIRCLFPAKLPIGESAFNSFVTDIFQVYGLGDTPNNRNAIASLIMHLGPTTSHKSKLYFYRSVLKSLANETAFETIQRLKKAEKEYLAKHIPKEEMNALQIKEV